MADRLISPRLMESEEETISQAAHDAVEVATTVKITDEAIEAFGRAWSETASAGPGRKPPGYKRVAIGLRAALEELGFEVEE